MAKPKNVIIVGGSLGGLMSGLMLKHLGHNVRIFERNPTSLLQDQGAGIVFGPEAQAFFSAHVPLSRSLTVNSQHRKTLARDGSIISQNNREQKMVSWDLLYFTLRACFDGVKSSYCTVPTPVEGEGQGTYEYSRKVTAVKDLGNEVEVSFEKEGKEGRERADLVVAADGPSSTVRRLLLPEVERKYVGYVAWRGTVPESEASELLKQTFTDCFTFFHAEGCQILAYLIPGKNGSVEPGERLLNWVWYCNYPADSPEYKDLMTDVDGHEHHFSMPVGSIKPELQEKQKKVAAEILPEAFAQLVRDTKHPFVQCITDVLSPEISFFGGRLLLMGDAVAGFRPHTAASTSQAAHDALSLEKGLKGQMGMDDVRREMMGYAREMQASGVKMGNRSQFGEEGDLEISQRA